LTGRPFDEATLLRIADAYERDTSWWKETPPILAAPPHHAAHAPMSDPAWAAFTDEQLLEVRMCDLGVTIEGTDLEARIAQLNTEMDARG
jgi:hypothetical protein